MTTAYTSLLGLALPVTGELSGTWGDVVNNSITSLLDSAVAGTTNVSTDGDVTLTTTTGAANTAREAILLFSGARTALRTVTAPAQSKVYTVINATTGGYAVKLVGSGPTTGLTIPNGASAVVAWNGSDFVEIGAGSIGNLIVNGTLTVTGATTLQSTLAVTGNITNTAGTANGVTYLNGSKVVTSGSALVFDGTNLGIGTSSPTNALSVTGNANITGNVTLGDASTDTVTVNGYMGVGGAPSASTALTVASTALTSTQQFGVSGQITGSSAATSLVAGVDAYPQTANASFTTTNVAGFYARAGLKGASNTASNWHGLYIADQTQGTNNYGITSIVSSGTNKFNIYASGTAANYFAGNVGIGTTAPTSPLHVVGAAGYVGTFDGATDTRIDFKNSGTRNGIIQSSSASFSINAVTSIPLIFLTSSAERLRIDSSGNLLLGTTATRTSAGITPAFQVEGITVNAGSQYLTVNNATAANSAIFQFNRSRGTANGAVTAVASGDTLGRLFFSGADGTGLVSAASILAQVDGTPGTNDMPGRLVFSTTADGASSPTERMRIDSSGNVGIGTSSPALKLDVAFSSAGDGIRSYNTLSTGFADVRVGNNSNNNLGYLRVGGSAQGGISQDSLVIGTAGGYPIKIAPQNAVTATFDVAGNLGLGVTPYAWRSTYKAFDTVYGAFYGATLVSGISNNATYTSTNWIYRDTQAAVRYEQNTGAHLWFTAPSGTAGDAITFTQAMTLNASGNLGIGTSSPQTKLDVASTNTATDSIGNAFIKTTDTQAADVGGKLTLGGLYNASSYYAFGGIAGKKENSTSGNVAGYLQFLTTTSAGALTERARIDSSGNFGIGITPSYKLDVNGTTFLRSTTTIYSSTGGAVNSSFLTFGSAALPAAASVYGKTDTATAGNLVFATAQSGTGTMTERGRFDGSGNFGIGTTAPVTALQVNSGSSFVGGFKSTVANGYIALQDSGTSGALTDGNVAIGAISNDLAFRSGGATRMRLDSAGNLGLGVTPSAWQTTSYKVLQIGATTSIFNDGGAYTQYINNAYIDSAYAWRYQTTSFATRHDTYNGQQRWFTAPSGTAGNAVTWTQAMTLDADGNLGVGTTSPARRLTVVGGTSDNVPIRVASGTGSSDCYIDFKDPSTTADYKVRVGSYGDALVFYAGGSERARIDSSGVLLVGNASSPQISAGSTGTISAIGLSASGTAIVASMPASASSSCIRSQSVTAAGTGWYFFAGASGNGSTLTTNNIYIYGNGNIQNTNNSYGAISDIKLKENIVDATPKLDDLMQVRVRNYNLKGDYEQHKQIGVVAQELETVFPSMVEETADKDLEGNDLGTTTKSVKYSVFVPMLIKAIQEQQAIIDSLKARLDAANL